MLPKNWPFCPRKRGQSDAKQMETFSYNAIKQANLNDLFHQHVRRILRSFNGKCVLIIDPSISKNKLLEDVPAFLERWNELNSTNQKFSSLTYDVLRAEVWQWIEQWDCRYAIKGKKLSYEEIKDVVRGTNSTHIRKNIEKVNYCISSLVQKSA